jgi:hypothetical protein
MLVYNAPVAIDFAKAHSQSEQKTVFISGMAGRVGSAPDDGEGEGDVRARGNGEFSKVEGRARLVVTKKQIPSLFVGFDALALKRRGQVEHDYVPLMVRNNGREIVPPDSIGPVLEKGCDPRLFVVVLFLHCFDFLAIPGGTMADKSDHTMKLCHLGEAPEVTADHANDTFRHR